MQLLSSLRQPYIRLAIRWTFKNHPIVATICAQLESCSSSAAVRSALQGRTERQARNTQHLGSWEVWQHPCSHRAAAAAADCGWMDPTRSISRSVMILLIKQCPLIIRETMPLLRRGRSRRSCRCDDAVGRREIIVRRTSTTIITTRLWWMSLSRGAIGPIGPHTVPCACPIPGKAWDRRQPTFSDLTASLYVRLTRYADLSSVDGNCGTPMPTFMQAFKLPFDDCWDVFHVLYLYK